jgi:Fe-S-cluster containining protein
MSARPESRTPRSPAGPFPAAPEADGEHIAARSAGILAHALATPKGACRKDALRHAVLESYALLERSTQADFDPPMACARGCSWCCRNQVSLTPPEAMLLGMHLEAHCTPDRLREITRRADAVLSLIAGKGRQEIGAMRHLLPCPLLEDETCSAHPARPLVCRGWNSVDPDPCRTSVERADPMTPIEHHAWPREAAEAVQLGLLQESQRAGLEAGFLVVTRAVRLMLALGVAECARAWLAGEPFFARVSELKPGA